MTTFEMRFIALAVRIRSHRPEPSHRAAKQINAAGEVYETKYGLTTSRACYGTVMENQEGNGPCYLKTEGSSKEQDEIF